ncbi:MAG TPA: hypothetical protein VMT81_00990 [Candidatus Paceibacterota bacterium]|nr:hypothetical protein [Candidatus Paceibacterota bacterium]
MAKFDIMWEAPEFEYREKGVSWYWTTIIIAALVIAFSVWENNFLFGFFVVVAEVLVIVWGNQAPRTVSFSLTESQLDIGGHRSHALAEFESWSAEEIGGGMTEMFWTFRGKLKTPLKVLVPVEKFEEVRKSLAPILHEVEHQPTLVDAIEKLLKF